MDSQQVPEEEGTKRGFHYVLFRFILALIVPILGFFSLSFMIGLVAVFVGELSIPNPVSVPSQCKIVSSSVDLRSSKVEYKDHSLGQTRIASAEAPDEALPLNCRPNFGAAWLTKDKFKVNETYDCWYTSGISKVSLYHDGFFSCQAKDPSKIEMIRRYSILSTKMVRSWLVSNEGRAKYWRWETVAGVVTGFSTSLITISFIRILQQMKSRLPQTRVARMVTQALNTICFKRACFLVAYVSVMGWLAIQYAKMLGLPKIFTHNT